jgi:hypothetical protein
MSLTTELNVWHIQCIYPALDDRGLVRYREKTNLFLEDIWGENVEKSPPRLEVDAVENSTITIMGELTPAVSVCLSFNHPPSLINQNDRTLTPFHTR